MDCKTAQFMISFFVPNHVSDQNSGESAQKLEIQSELDLDQQNDLNDHLKTCEECQQYLEVEKRWDERISQALQQIPVPIGLRDSIAQKLDSNQSVALRSNRGTWRSRARTIVAIGLLLAILAYYLIPQPTPISIDQVLIAHQESKENAERWLAKQGLPFNPQLQLDLQLLISYGYSELLQSQVPMLTLYQPDQKVFAKVYILRSRDFNFNQLPADAVSSFGLQIEMIPDSERPKQILYLVIHNAESLDPFREHRAGS